MSAKGQVRANHTRHEGVMVGYRVPFILIIMLLILNVNIIVKLQHHWCLCFLSSTIQYPTKIRNTIFKLFLDMPIVIKSVKINYISLCFIP